MKMLLTVEFPAEPFNSLVRNGKVEGIIENILETIKPEAAYFTEQNGTRGGLFIVEVPETSDVPRLAEPFFLEFNANCRFRILMTPEDLSKSGLNDIGKQWP
jgi:hypothetical protein